MKYLKTLIALAIISIVIQGAMAATTSPDVIRNSVTDSVAGRIDYAVTQSYDPAHGGAAGTITSPAVTYSNVAPDHSSVSAGFTGLSISKADEINSYLFAQSKGGDLAYVTADIGYVPSTSGLHKTASVTNYAMYGYVTPNLAYAGQYADKIAGDRIDLKSKAFNKFAGTIPTLPPAGNKATLPSAIVAPTTGSNGDSWIFAGEHTSGTASTGRYNLSKGYQFAQAGGSATPSGNGAWSQAVINTSALLNSSTAYSDGQEFMQTDAAYANTTGYMKSTYDTSLPTYIRIFDHGNLTTNSPSTGYADPKILYSNVDVASTPSTGLTQYATSSTQSYIIYPHTTYSLLEGMYTGAAKDVFVYSLINAANPAGISNAIFY